MQPSQDCQGLPIVAVMALCVPRQGMWGLGPLDPCLQLGCILIRKSQTGPWAVGVGWGTALRVSGFLWSTGRSLGVQASGVEARSGLVK